jgi:hypothetical protein
VVKKVEMSISEPVIIPGTRSIGVMTNPERKKRNLSPNSSSSGSGSHLGNLTKKKRFSKYFEKIVEKKMQKILSRLFIPNIANLLK